MKDSVKPVIKLGRTNASISDQGYTYNEAGLTYNQVGVYYGGLYEYDVSPLISRVTNTTATVRIKNFGPKLTGVRTNVQVYDQGITYNEAGLTYNAPGYAYGGLYDYDFSPLISSAMNVIPKIAMGNDFSGRALQERILGAGMLMGMLGLTYPSAGTVKT